MTSSPAAGATDGAVPPIWRRLLTATPIGWAFGIALGIGLVVVAESMGLQGIQTPLVLGVAIGVSTQQLRAMRPAIAGRGREWIAASCIGLVAPFVMLDVATIAGRAFPYTLVGYVALGGVLAGVLQWRILRTMIRGATGWLVAAPLGCFAAASTAWLNEHVLPKTPGLIGALQYLAVVMGGGIVFGIVTAIAAARFQIPDGGALSSTEITARATQRGN